MTTFEIIDAKRRHCGQMARLLRKDHLQAMALIGADPHRELSECFDQSAFRRAWLIDGSLAALGGLIGTLASGEGTIWLALSEESTHYPVAVIKEATRQIDALLHVKNSISAVIHEGDDASLRMAVFLGFHPRRSHLPLMGRKILVREIASDVDSRFMIGHVPMIPLELRA